VRRSTLIPVVSAICHQIALGSSSFLQLQPQPLNGYHHSRASHSLSRITTVVLNCYNVFTVLQRWSEHNAGTLRISISPSHQLLVTCFRQLSIFFYFKLRPYSRRGEALCLPSGDHWSRFRPRVVPSPRVKWVDHTGVSRGFIAGILPLLDIEYEEAPSVQNLAESSSPPGTDGQI